LREVIGTVPQIESPAMMALTRTSGGALRILP